MILANKTRIGPYEIIAPLGKGGMGEVYRASDTRLGRDVALKILPSNLATEPDRLRRFELEARAIAALNHPNVLAIHDIGFNGDVQYIVSELLEGHTLRELLRAGRINTRSAIEYAMQIALGLAAAHSKGIVHRDLKPENLFVTKDGRIKILDFGLATMLVAVGSASAVTAVQTEPGMVLGTVGYMSPEQVRGEPIDHRSDIFNFGLVLYEMVCGQRAFQGDSGVEIMNAILKDEPPNLLAEYTRLNISPAMDRIVRRCLEKQRDRRFQSAADIPFALEAISGSSALSELRPKAAGRLRILIAAATLIILVATMTWLALAHRSAVPGRFQPITYRRGSLQAARFTPDGLGVIYSGEWEGEGPQVQASHIGDAAFRPLGLPAGTIASVSSREGIAMLLGCEPFFVSDCGGTLAQVPAGGGAPRELLEHVHYADWSPDGSSLAVVMQDAAGHNRLEYPVGRVLYQTSGWITTPRISPDGKLVAFANHDVANDDRGKVMYADTQGTVRALTPELASVEGVAWSPSGTEVYFGGSLNVEESAWADSVYSVGLKGNNQALIHLPGIVRLHDVARDGRLLLSREVWRLQMIGLFPGDTAEHPYSWLDWSVSMGSSLSEDGRKLLFTEAGAAANDQFIPFLRPTDGSAPVRLGNGAAIALSPDGKWAAVVDMVSNRLSLLPTGAGQVRELERGPIEHYDFPGWWSGDGRVLTYAAQERGRGICVYSQDVSGGPPRQRTPELQFIGMLRPHFAVSADARFVAVVPAGSLKIHLFDKDGKDLGEARGTAEEDVPASFSSDGRLIVGPRHGSWPLQFFLITPATGKRELWKLFAPLDRAGLRPDWDLSVTPDLKYYTYSFTQADSELYIMRWSKGDSPVQ